MFAAPFYDRSHYGGRGRTHGAQLPPLTSLPVGQGRSDGLLGVPLQPDALRIAQHRAAEFSELVANEVSGIVLRHLGRSTLDWTGRALFGDARSLQDMLDQGMPHAYVPRTKDRLPAFLPLLGRPVETAPYTAAPDFPDFHTGGGDDDIDASRLLYSPVSKDFFITGPEYWMQRFLERDPQHQSHGQTELWDSTRPTTPGLRLQQRISLGKVRQHFMASHDGVWAGLINNGVSERFQEGCALLLAWGMLYACHQHWYQTAHDNLLVLRGVLDTFKAADTINQATADSLIAMLEAPFELILASRSTEIPHSLVTRPLDRYDAYADVVNQRPEDGDSTRALVVRLTTVWQANARDELAILDHLCSRLADESYRLLGVSWGDSTTNEWPARRTIRAVDRLTQWVGEGRDRDASYWNGRFDEDLQSEGFWSASRRMAEHIGQCLAMFEERVVSRLRPPTPEQVHGSQPNNEVPHDHSGVGVGLAQEIARGLIEVDCSQEDRREGELPPEDRIRFEASRLRLCVELAGPFSELEGYRHAADSQVHELTDLQQTQSIFGTAADYLRQPVTSGSGNTQGRTDGLLGLDPAAYYRAAAQEADEASIHQPASLAELLSEELAELKNRVPASRASSVFVGITDILRLCRAFEQQFGLTDEASAAVQPTLGRLMQAVGELRSKVRVQRAFWSATTTPDDVRRNNLPFWSQLDDGFERSFTQLRQVENQSPKEMWEGFWLLLQQRVQQHMRPILSTVVLYTIQLVEHQAAGLGDQATVDHALAQDTVYTMLRRGFDGGKPTPWGRVIRSRREKMASQALRDYTATEQRLSQVRVTERQRTWCEWTREHVLQHVRRSTALTVESMQNESRSLGLTHSRIDQWERERMRSLNELRLQSQHGDGVRSDSAAALRLFNLAMPAPCYTDCDTLVLGLKVRKTDKYHDDLVQEVRYARHYSAELEALLRGVNDDLERVIDGVQTLRRAAGQEQTYFLWATFDPLAVPPVQDFTAGDEGHTFYFQVRLYRTYEFYYQWRAMLFASQLANSALAFRREALRPYEQLPFLLTGEHELPPTGLAILGNKPAKPDEVRMEGPRFYRTLYLRQDLGCTATTTYAPRKCMGCRDAWQQRNSASGELEGIPFPCHDGAGADAQFSFRSLGFGELYGQWRARLVQAAGTLSRLTHDSGARQLYLAPSPFL